MTSTQQATEMQQLCIISSLTKYHHPNTHMYLMMCLQLIKIVKEDVSRDKHRAFLTRQRQTIDHASSVSSCNFSHHHKTQYL
mmetsp:Transcript_20212/g.34207  ORF Transcript_20212/g.34207 Transcript_20212/m.34207 type:complete len:82 (+) Transcript_20212:2166-2411(+)